MRFLKRNEQSKINNKLQKISAVFKEIFPTSDMPDSCRRGWMFSEMISPHNAMAAAHSSRMITLFMIDQWADPCSAHNTQCFSVLTKPSIMSNTIQIQDHHALLPCCSWPFPNLSVWACVAIPALWSAWLAHARLLSIPYQTGDIQLSFSFSGPSIWNSLCLSAKHSQYMPSDLFWKHLL